MEFDITAVLIVPIIVIGLPWLIMHYITRWKTAPTLTNDDESLLDELYQVARRLDARMDTVERLVAADNPEFQAQRQLPEAEIETNPLDEIERRRITKARTSK